MCLYSSDPDQQCNHPQCKVTKMIRNLYPIHKQYHSQKAQVVPFYLRQRRYSEESQISFGNNIVECSRQTVENFYKLKKQIQELDVTVQKIVIALRKAGLQIDI